MPYQDIPAHLHQRVSDESRQISCRLLSTELIWDRMEARKARWATSVNAVPIVSNQWRPRLETHVPKGDQQHGEATTYGLRDADSAFSKPPYARPSCTVLYLRQPLVLVHALSGQSFRHKLHAHLTQGRKSELSAGCFSPGRATCCN